MLTRNEQRTIFLALAFVTVAQHEKDVDNEAAVARIRNLAELIERFCTDDETLATSQQNLLRDAGDLLDAIIANGFDFSAEQDAEALLALIRNQQSSERIAV